MYRFHKSEYPKTAPIFLSFLLSNIIEYNLIHFNQKTKISSLKKKIDISWIKGTGTLIKEKVLF